LASTNQLFLASDRQMNRRQPAPVAKWFKSLGRRIVIWARDFADHWAAAAMYDQLSGLSDAQLARRGLSLGTLTHDVREAVGNDR
jgi:hypothetical protein